MRNSRSQVPHNTEAAGVEIARRIMKKKEMKAWCGDICHCLVIELNLLAKYISCSDQFTRSEGMETSHLNLKNILKEKNKRQQKSSRTSQRGEAPRSISEACMQNANTECTTPVCSSGRCSWAHVL